ncbi:MAG: hypothetical protein KAY59_05275 [Acidobacteria bacterium]|nr:hypothetical protein [Acidobacteriota bacterium]
MRYFAFIMMIRVAGIAVLLVGLVPGVQASAAQSRGPAAPNQSLVTARVTGAAIVDAASIGGTPPQPLCVLTLRVLSIAAVPDLAAAINDNEKTVRVYTKRTELARLKGTTVTLAIERKGDERGQHLWIVRVEAPKGRR